MNKYILLSTITVSIFSQSLIGKGDAVHFSFYDVVRDWENDPSSVKARIEKDKSFFTGVDDEGNTLLVIATQNDERDLIRFLLEKGADINGCTKEPENKGGGSDIQHTRSPLHEAVLCGYTEILQLLLNYHARVDVKNNQGETPLHFAPYAHEHKEVIVKKLVHAGANVNAKNNAGETPLHYAITCGDGGETVRILLDHGADVNVKNNKGETPLDIANSIAEDPHADKAVKSTYRKVVQLLIQKGGKRNKSRSEMHQKHFSIRRGL